MAEEDKQVFPIVDNFVDRTEPKNIIINFDGTGGQSSWGVQKDDKIPLFENRGGLSNICKIHLLAGGNIANGSSTFDDQLPLYYKGVGTWSKNPFMAGVRSAIGAGAIEDIYLLAYEHLKKVYKEGDKLFIFGFSRGAATARLFSSFLSKEANKINGITPEITFLGVFDTVLESSQYGDSQKVSCMDVDGKDSSLPANVKKAFHLVSLDDRREPFRPTLFNKDERVTEVWAPGNHSDVGGGYYYDGLSDVCLKAMVKEAKASGMKARKITENTDTSTIVGKRGLITNEDEANEFAEMDNDLIIRPNPCEEDIHDEKTYLPYGIINYTFFKHREVKKIENNKKIDEPVLVLESAMERVKGYAADVPFWFQYEPYNVKNAAKKSTYRPKNLVGVDHKVVTITEEGVKITEDKIEL